MSSNSFLRFDNLPTPIFIEPQNDNEWNTVLQWVLNNRSQCARFVLDGNVVPKNASSIGPKGGKTTILHKVIKSKTICPNLRLNLVQTIISSDSRSASVVDSQVSLPLHVAVRNEAKVDTITRDQILSILIQTYSAALLITDLVGCTPLHITCEELPGSEADVKKLIRAAPNAARIWNSSGVLPIHIACSKSCPEDVLELLLAAYPDSIDVNSISGGAPLGILRDSGGSEAAINVLKRRLRGYKAELGEDVVEIDDDDVVEVVKEEPKKRKRQKNIVKQPQKLVIVDSDDEDEVQVLKTENTKNSSDMNQRNDKPNEDFNNNLQYQALAQYQTNLGLNQNFYANQRPFLLGAYQSALPQRVPFQNSSSGSSILEDIKLRHQVEINQVKQSHAMVLNDIRRHLNRKTSNLDQSKSNVNKLKKELEDLKALYNEKTQERAALLKRKNEREEEETALRNELNSLKAQAEQNNKAHEALLQQLTSKFQQEIQAQKRRMELELEALNATQSKEISDEKHYEHINKYPMTVRASLGFVAPWAHIRLFSDEQKLVHKQMKRSNDFKLLGFASISSSAANAEEENAIADQLEDPSTHFLILPGFGNDLVDYTMPKSLVSTLASRAGKHHPHIQQNHIHVLPVQRSEWLNVFTNGIVDPAFWASNMPPTSPSFRWYLQKIYQEVNRIVKEQVELKGRKEDDVKVVLLGHSAGGWLARAAVGYGTIPTEPDREAYWKTLFRWFREESNNSVSSEERRDVLRQVEVREQQLALTHIAGIVTLGAPHLPPPQGVMDMTRGALRITNEKFPGAFHHPEIFYVTVAGNLIQGVQQQRNNFFEPTDVAGFAYESYSAVCGNGTALGDGVVPLEYSHLGDDFSIKIELPGVAHSINIPERWYGAEQVIDQWLEVVVDQLRQHWNLNQQARSRTASEESATA